jgi:cysteine desulfurase/selenocysteine lyase
MSDDGVLDLESYQQLFTSQTQLVSVTHVSNVLGIENPIEEIIRIAHQHGVPVLVDGAQSTPHMKVDIQQLDCDFFAFSGHKIYGPTGVGVLYGKEGWLDKLPPYQGGGEMIKQVTFEQTTFNELPYKFEAGTPDYVGTHALAVALDYVSAIGMENIHQHESELAHYALQQMQQIPDIQIYGLSPQHQLLNPISFNVGTIHHLDLGTLLDRLGIAVRTGHHCAEPLIHRLGTEGAVRISFGLYNTKEEVDVFTAGLKRVIQMF